MTFLPNLPQEEVFQAMQESDALLLSSVEEGLANVVLEAMAIGLPVVSSNCGGMSEVIQEGVNGFLFEVRDPTHLAAQVENLISRAPQERKHMAELARETIKGHHSLERLGSEMLDLYNSVLCESD